MKALDDPRQVDAWYFSLGGRAAGPYSLDDVLGMVADGHIKPNDMIWTPMGGEWIQACHVPSLFPAKSVVLPVSPRVSAELRTPQAAAEPDDADDKIPARSVGEKRSRLGRSYIARHWRGELSLGVSYWVNGFLGNIAAMAAAAGLTAALPDMYDPMIGLVGIVLISALVLLVTLWQVVGVWRSARSHKSRGGKAVWARIAQFMMVLACLQAANVLGRQAVPQITEAYRIVNGDPTVGTFELRLLNGGTEIEFIGGIPFGATKELRKFLDAAHGIGVVHLNSTGGRIAEARLMRDLIRERKLITYTSDRCLSACTIAYLGGVQRYVNPIAKLGFHSSNFPGLTAQELREVNNLAKREAVQFGVGSEFAEKAYSTTANTTMWYPSVQELLSARFATAISDGQFALSGVGSRPNPEDIARKLREIPLYNVVARADQARFGKLMDTFVDGAIKGLPEAQVYSAMRNSLGDMIRAYLPRASDDALIALASVLVEEVDGIGKVSPEVCHDYVMGTPGKHIELRSYLSPDVLQRDLRASEMILESGVAGAGSAIPPKEAEALGRLIFTNISRKYGAATVERMAQLGTSQIAKTDTCGLAKILYTEALATPAQIRGKLLRTLLTAK
ncbi:GYF domain-containing protein [Azospirillum tabaci]|uniref:GYF domain-containing protein n=1 Tax=Azospirillum tabaci TaxID=2752310 RepID=UPI0016617302|nr:GYF domain-containing protein [Azospirillum tabaci]